MTAPLVLLHGFVGGPWSYREVLGALESGRSVSLPTLSYHDGVPADALPNLDFDAEVERLAKVIAQASSAPVDLVGYSLGGRLALALTLGHPELVRRLILLSARRGLDTPIEREQRRLQDERWARLLETEGLESFLNRWWKQPVFRSLARVPPEVLDQERSARSGHHPMALAQALRRFSLGNQPSYAQAVRRLQVPVTLVTGALDEKFLELSRNLSEQLPNGRLLMVEGAGHHLALEAPRRVAQIINEVAER